MKDSVLYPWRDQGQIMSMLTEFINKIKSYRKTIKNNISIYKAQSYLIDSIDRNKFTNIYNPIYSMYNIHVLYKDIYSYNNILKECIKKIPNNQYIPVYDIKTTINIVSVKNWFIVDYNYIDIDYALNEFLSNSKEFIELYEYYSNLEDVEFNTMKNLDNTKVILNNLFTLLEDLKNVK